MHASLDIGLYVAILSFVITTDLSGHCHLRYRIMRKGNLKDTANLAGMNYCAMISCPKFIDIMIKDRGRVKRAWVESIG